MNEKQKKILKIVAFAMIGMLLFPPFYEDWGQHGGKSLGYNLALSPPKDGSIDKEMLLIQLLVVSAVGGIAFALRRDLPPK